MPRASVLQAKITQLQTDLTAAQQQVTSLTAAGDVALASLDECRTASAALQTQLDAALDDVTTLEARVMDMSGELADANAEVLRLRAIVDALPTNIQDRIASS